jgi:hypothetical protein
MPVLRGTVATTTDNRGTIKMKPLNPLPFERLSLLPTVWATNKYVTSNSSKLHRTVTENLVVIIAKN